MSTNVILPALGMSQDTGKIVQWLKIEGQQVTKGEPLVEIETDKATVEIEAPASGLLTRISARAGMDVPVGQVIAVVLARHEEASQETARQSQPGPEVSRSSSGLDCSASSPKPLLNGAPPRTDGVQPPAIAASALASRIAAEHHIDLGQVRADGQRIRKADVMAYLQGQQPESTRLLPASPRARRLAREQGLDLATLPGSGPEGAVLTADVLAAGNGLTEDSLAQATLAPSEGSSLAVSSIWRIMAERTARSWREVPHFSLIREVHASRMIAWRAYLKREQAQPEITYSDLLVKIAALALRQHPRLNSSWNAGQIQLFSEIHIGLAVALDDGLVVPVIHHADRLSLRDLACQRQELTARARAGKLRPQDNEGGTFTISNLGMFGVDAFHAIVNQPQAAILSVGRIAERVVPVQGQPAVLPMMALTLSCDHRAVDGALGARFLATLADLVEEPLGLLETI